MKGLPILGVESFKKATYNEKKDQKWEQNKNFLQNLYRFPSI